MFSLSAPFIIEAGESVHLETRAVLIAPNVVRRRLDAKDCDLVICDLAVTSPEFHAVMHLLGDQPVRALDVSVLAPLTNDFIRAHGGGFDGKAIRDLLHRIIFQFTGRVPRPATLHPRIIQVLQLIEEHPLRAVSPGALAEQSNISASRLRHLFRKEIGCSLSQYLRWNALWTAALRWSPGEPWAMHAKTAGFHDLAHFSRTFIEMFGMRPSTFSNPAQVLFIRREWDRCTETLSISCD
jgi:AraC-like DNA-binding protein